MGQKLSILQRVAAGDAAAVKDCQDRYGGLVWSLARRYLSNAADAEDAVQDIFIDVWSSAGRFRPDIASEATFISTIARRRLIDRLRHFGRRPVTDSIDADETGYLEPSVASELTDSAEVQQVVRVLNDMQPDHRLILSMSLWEGYSHSEIANHLDMPIGTVKTRIRRGLIHIREQLRLTHEAGADQPAKRAHLTTNPMLWMASELNHR